MSRHFRIPSVFLLLLLLLCCSSFSRAAFVSSREQNATVITARQVQPEKDSETGEETRNLAKQTTTTTTTARHGDQPPHHDVEHSPTHDHGVHVMSVQFEYVKAPLILAAFIIFIALLKLMYHHSGWLQRFIPESCCLIGLGVVLGLLFRVLDESQESIRFLEFDSKTFFLFLLPPIILEAAYSLKDHAFVDNFGTIILYAVVGTLLNIALLAGVLLGVNRLGAMSDFKLDPLDSLLFASLISAVDPVAVLAIFQEVGVNKMLYFLVFGESLLNDAVTVVCYKLVNEFEELPSITSHDCLLGLLAFLVVSFGGLFIGLTFGFLSSLVTRYTKHVRIIEPVVLVGSAYLSYVSSELFHMSGIIAIIACGLFQSHYGIHNISPKTFISVSYTVKVMSSVAEALIFIILGVMLVNKNSWLWAGDWYRSFAYISLVSVFVIRFVVVFALTWIVNLFTGGVRHISTQEQLIMSYGGLRGAVSFSLAFMIPEDQVHSKNTILAATYFVILFTVIIQGCTMKPLVKWMAISLAKKEDNFRLFNEFNRGMVNHMAQGMEDVVGRKDVSLLSQFSHWSHRYVRPLLQVDYHYSTAPDPSRIVNLDRSTRKMENAIQPSHGRGDLRRQQTLDLLADSERPEAAMAMLDHIENEPSRKTHKKSAPRRKVDPARQAEVDRTVEEITKDPTAIRHFLAVQQPEIYFTNQNDYYFEDEIENSATDAHRQKHLEEIRKIQVWQAAQQNQKRKWLPFISRMPRNTSQTSLTTAIGQAGIGALGVNLLHASSARTSLSQEEVELIGVSGESGGTHSGSHTSTGGDAPTAHLLSVHHHPPHLQTIEEMASQDESAANFLASTTSSQPPASPQSPENASVTPEGGETERATTSSPAPSQFLRPPPIKTSTVTISTIPSDS